MPELPEVETMCRGIRPIVGSRVEALGAVHGICKPITLRPGAAAMQRRLKGCTIEGIERLGKRVVVNCSGHQALVFEPRMTGLVLLADPPTREHLRVRIELAGGPHAQLWYWDRRGLGSVRLFTRAELAREFDTGRLGRDALAISQTELIARLGTVRRSIKPALLDQRAVAGIGNLYAAELLHVARIDPFCPCCRLSPGQWRRLHEAMQRVLREAIRHEGSTLSDGTYRNALNQAGGYQNHHRVYDRAGETCRTCGKARIVRVVQAQRATFYCPRCQKLKGPA